MNDCPESCPQCRASRRAPGFLRGEAGAASVDFVVLTAGIIGLALAAAIIFTTLSTNVMHGVSDRITTQEFGNGQGTSGNGPSQGYESDNDAEPQAPNDEEHGGPPGNWDCPAAGQGNAPGDCGAAARAANPGQALGPDQNRGRAN